MQDKSYINRSFIYKSL